MQHCILCAHMVESLKPVSNPVECCSNFSPVFILQCNMDYVNLFLSRYTFGCLPLPSVAKNDRGVILENTFLGVFANLTLSLVPRTEESRLQKGLVSLLSSDWKINTFQGTLNVDVSPKCLSGVPPGPV